MGNCENCEHWIFQGARGVCIQISEDDGNGTHISGAYYDSVELVTTPDFGCVLFEQKEAPLTPEGEDDEISPIQC